MPKTPNSFLAQPFKAKNPASSLRFLQGEGAQGALALAYALACAFACRISRQIGLKRKRVLAIRAYMIITHSFGSLSPFPSFSPFSSRLFTSPYFLLKSDISPKSDIPLEFSLYLSTAFLISMAHPPLTVAIPAGI